MAKRTFTPEQIINKVREDEVLNGSSTTAELNPSPTEVKDRVILTISSFEAVKQKTFETVM